MLYYEQSYCGLDDQPIELSEVYRRLSDIDRETALKTLYTIEVPLGMSDA